ncbi:hypothetical protein GCM10011379_17700 [Filimonas zeae]|uniref:Response regulatory domain-containing protein n=2 Tax=Filimonas zeae TaxID=1737353 RepID=A0A917IWA3_9BACT|nr:response regulator [Filimonas zeae]GGH65017.1 hypothetical protein GCM10011379_17700 [Filimonas zeae]
MNYRKRGHLLWQAVPNQQLLPIIAVSIHSMNNTLSGKKKRLLLVDDDMDTKTFVLLALCRTQTYFECIQVTRVADALKACNLHNPDLILLDYHMPGLNGIDFLKSFRKTYPESNAPIIFYSSLLTNDVKREALMLGVNAVIARPGSVATLTRMIEEFG